MGTLAFVRGGALELLNLNGCRVRTLVRSHVEPPVSMSSDGRWVAFRSGYVATRGEQVHFLDGTPVWPRGDRFAVVTKHGGLELGRAGGALHRVLPDGWGASTAVFSADGRRLAVSRTAGHGRTEEIRLLDLASRSWRELFREPRKEGAPLLLQRFSPDGRWLLFWKDPYASASMLADGVPLVALPLTGGRPQVVAGELYHDDYVSWCGGRLVYVLDHGGRDVTNEDGIGIAAPPSWRSTELLAAGRGTSWNTFACSTAGTLAIAAGPSNDDMTRFGREHRSIWLVHGRSARRLSKTIPPQGQSDEWPSWSADGRWLLFVRTRRSRRAWPGTLYALDLFHNRLIGPIAHDGHTENYYGYYGWQSQISWHRP